MTKVGSNLNCYTFNGFYSINSWKLLFAMFLKEYEYIKKEKKKAGRYIPDDLAFFSGDSIKKSLIKKREKNNFSNVLFEWAICTLKALFYYKF